MAKFNGSDMLLYLNDVAIAHARDLTFNSDTDTIDVTTKTNTGFADFLAGMQNSTIDFSGLVDFTEGSEYGFPTLWTLKSTRVDIQFVITNGNTASTGDRLTGTAIITNLSADFPMEDAASYSGTLQVRGDVTYTPA